jgi:ABC-type sugar transport system permease subunit
VVRGVLLSFTNARGVTGGSFVGLANYRQVFSDQTIASSIRNTIVFAVVVVIVQHVLALSLAFWVYNHPRLRNAVRGGLLLPAMMPVVTIAYVWTFIYSPVDGPLNSLLNLIGLGRFTQVWLGDSRTALLAIAVTNIWTYLGYAMAIYLAGYMSIDRSTIEAASLDGATGWRRFRHIDWPLLAPALTINITLSTIGSLRVFELPFVMTKGGPNLATETFSFAIYQQAFVNFQFGYGTAIAVVLLLVTVVVSTLLATVLRRREVAL